MKREDVLKKLYTALGDFNNLLALREISGSDVDKICDTDKDNYIDNLREDFLVLEKYGADTILQEVRGIGNMDYFRSITGTLRSPPSF